MGASTVQAGTVPLTWPSRQLCLHCRVGPLSNVTSFDFDCDITCKPQAPPKNFFGVDLSTYSGGGTWLGPIKVLVNGSLGEFPSVETRTMGLIKLPQSSCSGNAPIVFWLQGCCTLAMRIADHISSSMPLHYVVKAHGIINDECQQWSNKTKAI